MGGTRLYIQALHVPRQPIINFRCTDITIVNQFSPSWTSEQAYGKMDNIPYYSNTTRQMKVFFQTEVSNINNYTAKELNKNINDFIKFQYPRYVDGGSYSTIQAPPFFRLQHQEEFSDGKFSLYEPVEGYITGDLQVAPGHAEGIVPDFSDGLVKFGVGSGANRGDVQSNTNSILENIYKVTFTLTVLHGQVPGWKGDKFSGKSIFSFDQGNNNASI